MKRLYWGALLFAAAIAVSAPTLATAGVYVGIPLPPPIIFPVPPAVIVLPDTPDVYVDPDIDAELFFWDGWWWRLWEGRWYRSRYYDRSWVYYELVPSFYFDIDPGWRGFYRDRNWYGHRWDYERVPYERFHRDWRGWKRERHWRQRTWGVQGYQPRPREQRQELRQQRRQQFQQRPEVQRQVQPQERPQRPREQRREQRREQGRAQEEGGGARR